MTLDRELGLGNPVSWRAAHKKCMVKQLAYKEFIHAESVKPGVSNLFVRRMGGTIYFVVGMESGSIVSFCANEVGARGLGLGSGIKGFEERDFWKSEMELKMQCDGEVKAGRLMKSDASVRNWEFKLPGMVTETIAVENGESNLEVLYGFPLLVFLLSYYRVMANRKNAKSVSSLSGIFAHQLLSKTVDFIPRAHHPAGAHQYSLMNNVSDQRPTLSMAYSPDTQTIFYGLEKGIAFGQADGQARSRGAITNLRTDIFAAYCLPPDAPSHTGFLAGGRDGTVRLFDVRMNPQTRAPIMLNVGSVRHIRGLGQTGLVIRCVDSCAIYDLRAAGQDRKTPGAKSYCASRFRVPDGDGRKGGFDVYHEMGLMAVEGGGIGTDCGGSTSNERAVYLFDIESTDLLGKVPPGQVKFLEPEVGAGWPVVAVAGERGVGVYEW